MANNKTKKENLNYFQKKIKEYNNNVDKKTMEYQKKYNFKYNVKNREIAFWNNEGDAFKHTYMQADLTFKFGGSVATVPGYVHEIQNLWDGNPKNETNMDLWNNKVGRQIGLDVARQMRKKYNVGEKKNWQEIDDEIAKRIMEKMRSGELITNPNDARHKRYELPQVVRAL